MCRSVGFGIAMLASSFGHYCALADDLPLVTTVCDVVANPGKFAGKMIQIRAESIGGRRTTWGFHRTCHGFILFGVSRNRTRDVGVENLLVALEH